MNNVENNVRDNVLDNVCNIVGNNVEINVKNKSFTHKQLEQAFNNLELI
jgi:hypothetical protein